MPALEVKWKYDIMGSDRYWQDAQDTSRMADDLWREAGRDLGELQRGEGDFIRRVRPRTMADYSDERYLDKWRCLLDARYNDRYRVGACGDLRKLEPAELVSERSPLLLDAFRRRIRGHCFYVDSQDPSLEALQQQEPTPVDPSEDDLSSVPPTLLLSLSESDEERNEINTLP